MIFLLSFLPLFVSLFFAFRLMFVLLKNHHHSHFLCQKQLLKTQKEVLVELKRLFRLNPKAKALQMRYKRAKAKFHLALVSGKPLLIAKAKLSLKRIELSQLLLNQKQNIFIEKANHSMFVYAEEFKRVFKEENIPDPFYFSFSKKRLILKKSPIGSLSPIYSPPPFFAQKQALSLRWSLNIKDLLPFDLKNGIKKIFSSPLVLKGQCGASILRRKDLWQVVFFRSTWRTEYSHRRYVF